MTSWRQRVFISKGNFCSVFRGGLRHFMERRKVLRREVLATTCGSLLPKYLFTDVILQTRSCESPRKYHLDILQYKNQPSSKMRLCPNHTFSLSIVSTGTQVGPEIFQKVCENIFKLLSKDTPPLKPKAGTLLLLQETSNGTLQRPPLSQLQSSVFC